MIVDVPYSKELPYTLFSQGCTADVPHVDRKGFVNFEYKAETVVVLFYTFKNFRRAYIITEPKKSDSIKLNILPGCRCPVKIIFVAKGRKIDHLKRCLYILTQDDKYAVFKFSLIFWYKLAALIEFSGAQKSDIELLYNQFKRQRRKRK